MKSLLTFFISFFTATVAFSQAKEEKAPAAAKVQIVDASCGQCTFGLKTPGCDLAVRINGKAYFVDGTAIDEHGDAHAADGFCNAIRKAEVVGEVVKDRFKVTSFKLVKEEIKKD